MVNFGGEGEGEGHNQFYHDPSRPEGERNYTIHGNHPITKPPQFIPKPPTLTPGWMEKYLREHQKEPENVSVNTPLTNPELTKQLQDRKIEQEKWRIEQAKRLKEANEGPGTWIKEGFLYELEHPILAAQEAWAYLSGDSDGKQLVKDTGSYADASWWNAAHGFNIYNALTDKDITGADGKQHSLLSVLTGGLGESYVVDAMYIGAAVLAIIVLIKV